MQRPVVVAMLLIAVLIPGVARTQPALSAGLYIGRNDALPTPTPVTALGITLSLGSIGVRGSGAIGLTTQRSADPIATAESRARAWTADADLLLAPLDSRITRGLALGGVSPYVFVGTGVQSWRQSGGATSTVSTWSYGGGLSLPLLSALRLEADARFRVPREGRTATSPSMRSGWEYRLGLAVRFGGGAISRRGTRSGGGVGAGGTAPEPTSTPTPVALPSVKAQRVLSTADRYLGVPYRYGGTSPATGFDCSGFVQYVFAKHAINLPRTSRQMTTAGARLPADFRALRAGDLVMFAQDGARISHVAIYAGRSRIIHSSSSGGGVRYDNLRTRRGRWFVERLVAARRVVEDGRSLVNELDALGFGPAELDPPDHAPSP